MTTALILSGGGARAAYQVGVMRAAMEIHGRDELPFEVICGTSAGAINAVFIAANAHRPREGLEALLRTWRGITPADVYDPRWRAVIGSVARIVLAPLRRSERAAPRALLDSEPLRGMLRNWLDFDAVRANLSGGRLQSLCITAMDYATGASVAFYEGGSVAPWDRVYRRGEPARLEHQHVMASAAIPILFPAQRIVLRRWRAAATAPHQSGAQAGRHALVRDWRVCQPCRFSADDRASPPEYRSDGRSSAEPRVHR